MRTTQPSFKSPFSPQLFSTVPCPDKSLAIVDVETNGGWGQSGHVIEIGILRVEKGIVIETYRSLINPGRLIPAWITRLTGIRNEELERAPYFDEIVVTIQRLLKDAVFVAHNVGFDYACLQNEFRRLEMSFSSQHLCTVELSRALYPRARHHDLSSIIAQHGFACAARHRAFDDAQVLWDFIKKAARERADMFDATVEKCIRKPRVGPRVVEPLAVDEREYEALIL